MLLLVSSITAPACRTHLATFVTADFRFDIPAIKAVAEVRYAARLGFINSYTGTARRFWQRQVARRLIGEVWKEAHRQRHELVWARLPHELPFTTAEIERRQELRAAMCSAPISMQGNARYREAAGEYGAIGACAQKRAYDAIISAVGRPQ